MNKPASTKGPWEHHFLSGRDRIVGPSGECIAETGRWKESELPEMHANARLIAAAPELLESLKELSRLTHQMNALQHAGIGNEPGAWGELYQITNDARAAIAKAEGRD